MKDQFEKFWDIAGVVTKKYSPNLVRFVIFSAEHIKDHDGNIVVRPKLIVKLRDPIGLNVLDEIRDIVEQHYEKGAKWILVRGDEDGIILEI